MPTILWTAYQCAYACPCCQIKELRESPKLIRWTHKQTHKLKQAPTKVDALKKTSKAGMTTPLLKNMGMDSMNAFFFKRYNRVYFNKCWSYGLVCWHHQLPLTGICIESRRILRNHGTKRPTWSKHGSLRTQRIQLSTSTRWDVTKTENSRAQHTGMDRGCASPSLHKK